MNILKPKNAAEETKQFMYRRNTMYVNYLETTVEKWLQVRKEEALLIDPDTAEVDWRHARLLDPYGIGLELSEEEKQVGREYFALNPGSDIWVWFGDLPKETEARLWERHKSRLAFPAGITF